jgi:hypothetical protein
VGSVAEGTLSGKATAKLILCILILNFICQDKRRGLSFSPMVCDA